MDLIVGTAGHIDHGKTSLVKALTGVDADRLPEEKQRGITIDLGFAEMQIGEHRVGFVDVPGHERFVKNMLAGASGIDVMLLVIAADEGVMPQTREHFEICRLLGVKKAIIAITKIDLVDSETVDLGLVYAAELLQGTPYENPQIVRLSAKDGRGIEDLKNLLSEAAANVKRGASNMVTRLPIDRSFTVKGFGTVVTGTVVSGGIDMNTRIELMPAQIPVRVRGLQAHGTSAERLTAGQRAAVNVAGIEHSEIARGMELVQAEALFPTQVIDAQVEVLSAAPKPLRSRQRVRVHLGTAEVLARLHVLDPERPEIDPGNTDLLQLRLESPVVAVPGQRFIIRSYSPQMTIAGGRIIDNRAERHRRRDLNLVRHRLLERVAAAGDPVRTISMITGHRERFGVTRQDLRAATGLADEVLDAAISRNVSSGSIINADGTYICAEFFDAIGSAALESLASFHRQNPLEAGMSREALRLEAFPYTDPDVGKAVLSSLTSDGRIAIDKDLVRLSSHSSQLSPDESRFAESLSATLENAGLEVPRIAEAIAASRGSLVSDRANKLLHMLVASGRLIKVSDEFYFAKGSIDRTIELIRNSGVDALDVAAFKGLTGVSRKYAIPLLEYLDRIHVTARVGDKRVIIR